MGISCIAHINKLHAKDSYNMKLRVYIFIMLLLALFVNYDINNNLYLYRKEVLPLFTEKSDATYSIVIDPGHGGIDKGTSYQDLYEKDINLKIGLYLKEYLEDKGVKVYMTREEDILLSLREIGDFVNEIKPHAFISIHVNSFKEPSYDGFSAFYYSEGGFQKEERIELAQIIQEEVSNSGLWFDREIKEQNIAVLRYSNYPCALLEIGFMTNEKDRERLTNENILKTTGESIGKGILKYVTLKN